MSLFLSLLLMLAAAPQDELTMADRAGLTIINTGKPMIKPTTEFDAGFSVGNMLNNHYFPGVLFYNGGRYQEAESEFVYCVRRTQYLDGNPRKNEFLSTAHYLRGMIYLYHATGVGRHSLARSAFEASIAWNPAHEQAHLELSRVYANLGFKDQAKAILQKLLALEPGKEVLDEARQELAELSADATSTPRSRTKPPSQVEVNPAARSTSANAAGQKQVAGDRTADAQVQDRKPEAAALRGTISVNAVRPADIYKDGQLLGSTPTTLELPVGETTLEFRSGDLTKTETYTIKAGENMRAIVAFDLVIGINAVPWAEVFIEDSGKSLGQTPLSGVHVQPGTSLVFKHPSLPEKKYTVNYNDQSIQMVLQ
jgi:tetratricopeptide (TPR) repeat protein